MEINEKIETTTLSSGLKLVFRCTNSTATYVGVALKGGTRDEGELPEGTAHFVEHMLFKGTKKRKPWHILNRMEAVGGELNAYTSKEEMCVYTIAPRGELARAVELLGDICLSANFPQHELNLERSVIIDEMNVYRDTPAELIFDDFETLIYRNHPLGRTILGNEDSVKIIDSDICKQFHRRHFVPANMVFFCMGPCKFSQVIKLAEQHFHYPQAGEAVTRKRPEVQAQRKVNITQKNVHQSHLVMGGKAPSVQESKRYSAALLCNILGGPGMNSLLNISLREKKGLVYQVDATLNCLTDNGYWQIYFGCDPENLIRSYHLVQSQLRKLCEEKLSPTKLRAAKKQMSGQLLLSAEQNEQTFLSMGKAYLNGRKYLEIEEVQAYLSEVSADELQSMAQVLFEPNNLFIQVYHPKNLKLTSEHFQ